MKLNRFSPLAITSLLSISLLEGCTDLAQSSQDRISNNTKISVYFSPKGGTTEALLKEIGGAKNEILVQAGSFTSKPIAQALVNARKRGVNVQVIFDKNQRNEKYSEADLLVHAHIPVYADGKHALAHNNSVIIDSSLLLAGSFNFTKAAEEINAENLLVIRGNKILVNRYIQNFELHKAHSEMYRGQTRRMDAETAR